VTVFDFERIVTAVNAVLLLLKCRSVWSLAQMLFEFGGVISNSCFSLFVSGLS
jgi:hypothetical protein